MCNNDVCFKYEVRYVFKVAEFSSNNAPLDVWNWKQEVTPSLIPPDSETSLYALIYDSNISVLNEIYCQVLSLSINNKMKLKHHS